jgi:hypothetical protein
MHHFLAAKQSLILPQLYPNLDLKTPQTPSNLYPKLTLFVLSNLLVKKLTQFWLQTLEMFYPNFAKFKRTKKTHMQSSIIRKKQKT